MKIIDAHLHFSDIESFKRTARELSFLDYSSQGLITEFEEAGIVAGIGMGVAETAAGGFPDYAASTPMGLDLEQQLPANLMQSVGINPFKLKDHHHEAIHAIETELGKGHTAGIKIYAGYYPFYVYDDIYEPVYELAAKYELPVTIHSGDTYSDRGLLKYSHPINIDELAVKHKEINFIIAHFGDPWIMDTAEIIRKNPNAYADLSGLIVGDFKTVERFSKEQLFVEHIKRGLVYADSYGKVLFGTDWPLVQVKPYIEFIKKLVPEEHHTRVFYLNALNVFKRLQVYIKL